MDGFKKQLIETQNFYGEVLLFDQAEICAILLSGSLDSHIVQQLRDKISALENGKQYNYIVDLDGVTFISSTGLGFLMYLLKNRLEFVILSQPNLAVMKPFNLLGIKERFRYYQTIEDLAKQPEVPKEVLPPFWVAKDDVTAGYQRKKWVNILRGYLAEEELASEIEYMSAYLNAAEHQDTITLPADEKYASMLYIFLGRVFGRAKVYSGEPIDEGTIELVAKELMTNAVKHGYGRKPGGMVEAGYTVDLTKVEISFTDHGRGYLPSPAKENGMPPMGMDLLRKIFDQLSISPAPQTKAGGLVLGPGTTVRMVKYLKPKASP
jgi:anti-anti-sigma factor